MPLVGTVGYVLDGVVGSMKEATGEGQEQGSPFCTMPAVRIRATGFSMSYVPNVPV